MTQEEVTNQEDRFPRESELAEKTLSLARAAVDGVPFIGPLGGELLGWLQPPLTKRQVMWLESIALRLRSLEEQFPGFTAERAFQDEAFVSIFQHASQAAIRSHQEEKLEALRNAVSNSALPSPPDEALQLMFVNCVDEFTPWHIRLLQYFRDPIRYALDKAVISAAEADQPREARFKVSEELFLRTFPALRGQEMLIDAVIRELEGRNLIEGDWPNRAIFHHSYWGSVGMRDRSGEWIQRQEWHPGGFECFVTAAGKQFLAYISSPIAAATAEHKESRC